MVSLRVVVGRKDCCDGAVLTAERGGHLRGKDDSAQIYMLSGFTLLFVVTSEDERHMCGP